MSFLDDISHVLGTDKSEGWGAQVAPIAAGYALGPAGFGLMSAGSAGLAVGGLQGLLSHDMNKGLMAGLAAYGGAGLGEGLMSAGKQAVESGVESSMFPLSSETMSAAKADALTGMSKLDMAKEGLKAAAGNPTDFMKFAGDNKMALAALAGTLAMNRDNADSGLASLPAVKGRFQYGHWNPDGTYTNTGSSPVSEGYPTRYAKDGGLMRLANGGAVAFGNGGFTSIGSFTDPSGRTVYYDANGTHSLRADEFNQQEASPVVVGGTPVAQAPAAPTPFTNVATAPAVQTVAGADDWMTQLGTPSGGLPADFDWQKYLSINTDLGKAGVDTEAEAKRHYANFGTKESRNYGAPATTTTPSFNTTGATPVWAQDNYSGSSDYSQSPVQSGWLKDGVSYDMNGNKVDVPAKPAITTPAATTPPKDTSPFVVGGGSPVVVGGTPVTQAPAPAATPSGPKDDWMTDLSVKSGALPADFDWQKYISSNKDLADAGIDTEIEAKRHYSNFGANEKRNLGIAALAPKPATGDKTVVGGTPVTQSSFGMVGSPPPATTTSPVVVGGTPVATAPAVTSPAVTTPSTTTPTTATTPVNTPVNTGAAGSALGSSTKNPSSAYDLWTSLKNDPAALRAAITQSGLGVQDVVDAVPGLTLETAAQILNSDGGANGWGGLRYNADGSFYGTDWAGLSTKTKADIAANAANTVNTWTNNIKNRTMPARTAPSGVDSDDVYAYLMGTGKNPFTQNAKWKPPGTTYRQTADAEKKQKDEKAKESSSSTASTSTASNTSATENKSGSKENDGAGYAGNPSRNYADAARGGIAKGGKFYHPDGKFGYGGPQVYADGGLAALAVGGQAGHLGSYSDGGRLLKGPGDGVSDSIPATIGQGQPARLADGEFVVPARIVSELGNGSTDAGARKLYQMMDRIQKNRAKTIGKNRTAVNSKSDKYLPA